MKPLVSVIIPVFNGENFIASALESVFSQTYKTYEVIVVDDGSTDRTKEIISQFSDKVTLIQQPNSGPAKARNNGIANSKGELIAFLDHDDMWLSDKLDLQVKALEENPNASFIYSDFGRFDEQGVIEQSEQQSQGLCMPSGYVFPYLFFDPLCWTSTVLIKRTCFEEIGNFDEDSRIHRAEDYDLWIRLSKRFEFHYLNTVTAMYRQSSTSLSKNAENGIKAEIYMLNKNLTLFPEIRKELGRGNIRKRFSVSYFELAYHQANYGAPAEAQRNFWKAISLWPMNSKYWTGFVSSYLPTSIVSKFRNLKKRYIHSSRSVRANAGRLPQK